MELKKDFAELITSARKSKKMTQQELSALINVSDKAISNWETGKNIPDYEILKKLEKILDISLFNESKEKRYFKYLIIIPLIFLIILFIYFIFNYNKVNYYTVTLDSEDFVLYDSTILKIDKEYIINLSFLENLSLPYQPSYKVSLYYLDGNKKKIIAEADDFNKIHVQKELDRQQIKNNLYLSISYKDYTNEYYNEEIKLKLKKVYSNSKILNSYKPNLYQINQNSKNLLKNNSYLPISDYIYIKQYNNDYYIYNVKDNIFYYRGRYNEYFYYAKIIDNKKYYIVLKENEIVGYKTSNKYFYNEKEDFVLDKLDEYNKLIYE